jgi:hypothetical protein
MTHKEKTLNYAWKVEYILTYHDSACGNTRQKEKMIFITRSKNLVEIEKFKESRVGRFNELKQSIEIVSAEFLGECKICSQNSDEI